MEYDLFGSHHFNPLYLRTGGGLPRPCDRERIEQIIELIEAGYLKQILISQDMCMKNKMVRYGGYGYAHILRNMLPYMRNMGMTREQIQVIIVENPKKMLQFV